MSKFSFIKQKQKGRLGSNHPAGAMLRVLRSGPDTKADMVTIDILADGLGYKVGERLDVGVSEALLALRYAEDKSGYKLGSAKDKVTFRFPAQEVKFVNQQPVYIYPKHLQFEDGMTIVDYGAALADVS